MELIRIPRAGGISISSTESGVLETTVTETLRTGLTLKSIETIIIHQGESVTLTAGLGCNLSEGREFAALRV
jgi:hypothetical protein